MKQQIVRQLLLNFRLEFFLDVTCVPNPIFANNTLFFYLAHNVGNLIPIQPNIYPRYASCEPKFYPIIFFFR